MMVDAAPRAAGLVSALTRTSNRTPEVNAVSMFAIGARLSLMDPEAGQRMVNEIEAWIGQLHGEPAEKFETLMTECVRLFQEIEKLEP
jgi:hypothetical protein